MSGAAAGFPAGEITHRGIVNTPECDENGHMNVQFYWARFSLADAQFRLMQGLEDATVASVRRLSRHVRYHAELHGAHGIAIVSRFALGAGGDIHILHQMVNGDLGTVSATALDRVALSADLEAQIRARGAIAEVPAHALPRSLTGAEPDFEQTQADCTAGGAVLTCRTAIEPHLTGIDGMLTDRGFIGLGVEAAPASWLLGGFSQSELTRLGLGRVVVEKRLTVKRRPLVGDLIHILSRIIAVERVTFSVQHRYFDSRSGEFLCECDVTLLPMDLTQRKAVPLPDEVRAHMLALAGGTATLSP